MAEDSGLMDWSACGMANDLSAHTPRPYYRDLAMPGGFPCTPFQPSAPIFERVRPATNDGPILNASKRICTEAARVASAVTFKASTSMTAIIRNMPQLRFRTRRTPRQLENRSAAVSINDLSAKSPFPSPLGHTSTPKEGQTPRIHISPANNQPTIELHSHSPVATQLNTPELRIRPQSTTMFWSPFSFFTTKNAILTSKTSHSPPDQETSIPKEAQTSPPHIPEPVVTPRPVVNLRSPYLILLPTDGKCPASPQHVPDSSPARQLAGELDTAAEESDSSSTFDGNWLPSTPTTQIQKSTTPTIPLSSAFPDTADWYHDGISWRLHSDFTVSPAKDSTVKSRAEVLEEGQGSSRKTRRSILKAKIALGDTSKFDIIPLSDEWEAKVNNALKHGHGRLQSRDFQKIVPPKGKGGVDAWLNDESINEYLALVTKNANKEVKLKSTPRMHAFSTFFFTSLREGGYKKVARWAKRANLAGAALLDVEKIFIPINPSQSHWTLAVIQPRIQRVTHYNSYGSGSKAYLDVICEWLKGELGAGFNKEDWDLDYSIESPQQTNGSDCGVFTVTTAKQIMLGISPMTYGAADIPTQRRRMVAELVNGELLQIGM